MWLLFLGLHVIGLTGYNLVLRKLAHGQGKVDAWVLATIMQTVLTIPLLFILPFRPPDLSQFDTTGITLTLVVTALTIGLHLSNVKALQYLEASVYAVLYNLRILFATLLGILILHEDVLLLQLLGGLLIFLAVVTVRQKGSRAITRHGLAWGIGASLVISFLNLTEKELISTVGFLTYAPFAGILATLIMWAILVHRGQRVSFAIIKRPGIMSLMALRSVSAYGFILAFIAGAGLSIATYISSLSVIASTIFGMLLLGETDYFKQKVAAASLATAGLTLIFLVNL